MLRHIQEGKIDCVLVYRLDRLTRSVSDLYSLLDIFEEYNCKFKSATEIYDTTTAMGRLFITLVAALAQWERENMGERIRMGYQEKVRQGKYAAQKSPYGYSLDRKQGKLSIISEEAAIVKKIFQLYLNGLGVAKVATYLNDQNSLTRAKNSWNDTHVMYILKNPVYIGSLRWNKDSEEPILIEDAVPAIIDKKSFEDVQKTIKRRSGQHPRLVASDYIFSGLLKCPQCGYPLVGKVTFYQSPNGEKIRYKFYRCKQKKNGICTKSRSISEKKLESIFLDYVVKLKIENDINNQVSQHERSLDEEDNTEEIKRLNKELTNVEKRRKKWQYAWSNDMIDDKDFTNRMSEERTVEQTILEQLKSFNASETSTPDKDEINRMLKELIVNWNYFTDKERKEFLQIFIKQINVVFGASKRTADSAYISGIEFI